MSNNFRAALELCQKVRQLSDDSLLTISCMEVYNEKIIDLLNEDPKPDLKLFEDAQGLIEVEGLTKLTINSFDDFRKLFLLAKKRRTVGAVCKKSIFLAFSINFSDFFERKIKPFSCNLALSRQPKNWDGLRCNRQRSEDRSRRSGWFRRQPKNVVNGPAFHRINKDQLVAYCAQTSDQICCSKRKEHSYTRVEAHSASQRRLWRQRSCKFLFFEFI